MRMRRWYLSQDLKDNDNLTLCRDTEELVQKAPDNMSMKCLEVERRKVCLSKEESGGS